MLFPEMLELVRRPGSTTTRTPGAGGRRWTAPRFRKTCYSSANRCSLRGSTGPHGHLLSRFPPATPLKCPKLGPRRRLGIVTIIRQSAKILPLPWGGKGGIFRQRWPASTTTIPYTGGLLYEARTVPEPGSESSLSLCFLFGLAIRTGSALWCDVIHPTAIIHPKAEVHPTVKVGPYAVIDEGGETGPHCVVGPHVYLSGTTEIGEYNRFFFGAVIGEAPQDLKYKGAPTTLRINDRNVFREHVTVNRATELRRGYGNWVEQSTDGDLPHRPQLQLGQRHHHCQRRDAGGAREVSDRAIISGSCLVHQFVRSGLSP